MSNYIKATNFASKDALPTGNAAKTVSGTEIDDEFTALATSISTKANTASPTLTGTPAAPTAGAGTDTTQIATTAYTTAAIAAIPAPPAVTAAVVNTLVYPVGAIFTTTFAYADAAAVDTVMGVGTWAAFGAGRVLLGAGSVTDNQPVPVTQVFTAGDTEGELSHTNTVAEMPSHSHQQGHYSGGGINSTQAPQYTGERSSTVLTSNDPTTSAAGSGDAHNNLQPYIVVYFWKRTA